MNGNGTMHITVSNMLGQRLMQATAESYATLDLTDYGQGIYIVRIETANGVKVQKVNLQK